MGAATRRYGLSSFGRTRWVAWLLTVVVSVGCADSGGVEVTATTVQPILGGTTDDACAWPAVVSLGGCSGTLIGDRLVVYAAHCGTAIDVVRFGVDATEPDQVVPVDFCGAYPDARLGDGSDLAYCVLSRTPAGVRPARVLAGCEAAELRVGSEVQLVGFGIDGEGAPYGQQRSVASQVTSVGDELLISASGVDTCRGDSGGPVFLKLADARGEPEWRAVGVTSAGSAAACGEGTGHYVNLLTKIDWLEDASGMDVTPCFDHGAWAPTPGCVSQQAVTEPDASAGSSGCLPTRAEQWLDTCGEPWHEEAAPAPVIHFEKPAGPVFRARLSSGESYLETDVELVADAVGAGLRGIDLTLRDQAGSLLVSRTDQVPPYGLPALRLPPGRYSLEARADDFADQTASDRIAIEVDGPDAPATSSGCAIASWGASSSAPSLLALLFAGCWRRRGRRLAMAFPPK